MSTPRLALSALSTINYHSLVGHDSAAEPIVIVEYVVSLSSRISIMLRGLGRVCEKYLCKRIMNESNFKLKN